jgi:hypothetical protein
MDLDSFMLSPDTVESNANAAELVALKTVVRVMATVLAKGHEQVGGLSAQSYIRALEECCLDALTNGDVQRSDDLGAHAFRLAAIKEVNAILYGTDLDGTDLARNVELN